LDSKFDNDMLTWWVEANIEGKLLSYQVPLLGEHAPLASVSVLLAIHHLGFDVAQAARDYAGVKSAETMGKLSLVTAADKSFYFYDHSHRASVLSYSSALKDLARLKPLRRGRKIAVIGNMLNIGDISRKAHEDLAALIEAAGVERLYTVGQHATALHSKLNNPSILIKHADTHQEIEAPVLADIQDGDLIFIKGHHRIWLKFLAEKIYSLGARHEIR
jgi:UDP-N-acetylmuramoyl-tripeptide--D-alanyl-D-alanine ligase